MSIIGKPNAGKSTLLNAILGRKLSIITPKASTTRHRILGIDHGENYQMVFSDTPGVIKPKYKLHDKMMSFVNMAVEDADLIVMGSHSHSTLDTLFIGSVANKVVNRSSRPVLLVPIEKG